MRLFAYDCRVPDMQFERVPEGVCVGGGVLTYKMGMYVTPYVKKKGAYGAAQTEKSGCFQS